MLLAIFIVGVLIGVAIGAFHWRSKVVRLNEQIRIKDQQLKHTDSNDSDDSMPEFDYGLKMYRMNKFEQAFPIILYHANAGHPIAISLLAKMYFAGNGVEKSEPQYKHWLRKAAETGDKAAKAKSKRL